MYTHTESGGVGRGAGWIEWGFFSSFVRRRGFLRLPRFSLGLVANMAGRILNFVSGGILPLDTSGSSFHLPVCLPI